MENTNNSEVRKLRSSIKDAGAFRARIEEQINKKQAELVDQQHALMDQYPGTYLAKYLGWKTPNIPTTKAGFSKTSIRLTTVPFVPWPSATGSKA